MVGDATYGLVCRQQQHLHIQSWMDCVLQAVSDVLTAGESDLNVPKLSWRERALLKKQQTVETGSGSAVR